MEEWAKQVLELELSSSGATRPEGFKDRGLAPPGLLFARELLAACRYGSWLSRVVLAGWTVLAFGFSGDQQQGNYNVSAIREALNDYDGAWAEGHALRVSQRYLASLYVALALHSHCTPIAISSNARLALCSLARYLDTYRGGSPGLGASVDLYRSVVECGGCGRSFFVIVESTTMMSP